jgi:hypothetical protein
MKQLLLVLAVVASACGGDEPPPPEPAAPQGRAETQTIRNTDAVGAGGGAIADKVDAALDKNDEAAKKLQEEADRQAE